MCEMRFQDIINETALELLVGLSVAPAGNTDVQNEHLVSRVSKAKLI